MNRWLGSAADSANQATARDRRAAQRYIQNLPPVFSDNEDDFLECETSFSNLNVDGEGGDMAPTDAEREQHRLRELTKPFDLQNFDDDSEAWKKELKIKFDENDVGFWFNA